MIDIEYAGEIAIITDSLIDTNILLHHIEDTDKDIGYYIKSGIYYIHII